MTRDIPLSGFVATRNETVTAGLQQTFTAPPTGLGSEPYGVRYQIWLTVPTTDTYRLAVYADDGFILNGQGLTDTNTTTRGPTTVEAYRELTLLPNTIYNFGLTYLNYSAATTNTLQLLWRKGGGALEVVPRESIHARGRRDYYSFGGAVVAVKEGVISTAPRVLSYLHGDHLGSVSLTTNAAGQKVSEQRYAPYGEVRWRSGAGMPTDFTFTGQRAGPANYVGSLMDYVARGYSPALGRFVSADTIVPGARNPAAFNRYMYVFGNPLSLRDPSGHDPRGSQNNCNYGGQGCGGAGSQVDITTRHIILAGTQWYYAGMTADPSAGLDAIQTVLDVAGLVPGIGEVADGANALISVGRGDLAGAGLSAISMIPVAGDLIGKGGKAGRFAAKHADEAMGLLKGAPNPHGIAGKPDHVLAVRQLGEELKDKWGDGFEILDRQTLNTASNGKIPLVRKPDKIVRDKATQEIVEIGEAYRPLRTSWRPKSAHELNKILDYAAYDLPVVWYQIPR